MPEYTVAAVLAPVAVVALELLVLRTGLLRTARYWIAVAIVLGFQLPVDWWLTRPEHTVVHYREQEILGPRVLSFPVEDFGFGFALVTLTLLLWRGAAARLTRTGSPATMTCAAHRPGDGQAPRRGTGGRRVKTVRWHHRWLDHLIRAAERFRRADGRRLAAAVTYYGFFATFALGLLGFSALGYLIDDPAVAQPVQRFLDANLPGFDTTALREARGTAGVLALAGLPVIGLLWVDSLRSSVRAVWRIEEYPGRLLTRWFIDGLVLVGLVVLIAASLAVSVGAQTLLSWLGLAVLGPEAGAAWLAALTRAGLGFGVNTLLAVAVLTLLPRLRMPWRRVLVPALLVAAGVEVLTGFGRLAVDRAETNPAFQVVAGAAGLLVFLLILNQLILFAAALTATGTTGQVKDLATGHILPAGAVVVGRQLRAKRRPPAPSGQEPAPGRQEPAPSGQEPARGGQEPARGRRPPAGRYPAGGPLAGRSPAGEDVDAGTRPSGETRSRLPRQPPGGLLDR